MAKSQKKPGGAAPSRFWGAGQVLALRSSLHCPLARKSPVDTVDYSHIIIGENQESFLHFLSRNLLESPEITKRH